MSQITTPQPVPSFSIGSAIEWSWRLTWRNFWRYLLVAIVFVAINAAVSFATNLPMLAIPEGMPGVDSTGAQVAVSAASVLIGLAGSIVQALVSAYLALGTIRIALSVTRGEDVELGTVFKFDGYGWYLLCSLIVGIVVSVVFLIPFGLFGVAGIAVGGNTGIGLAVLGAVIGVVIAFVVTIGFTFFGYAIVDRKATGLDGLKISWKLVRPHFWSVLGLGVLLMLIFIGLMIAAVVLGILMIIIGLLVTLPIAGVIVFGMGSLAYAYAYRTLSGEAVAP